MSRKEDQSLDALLNDAAPRRFASGFADRVAGRVAVDSARKAADFETVLERQFVRIVPFLAAASLVLALYGWWGGRSTSDSVLDATLHLPQVSIANVYVPDVLYGPVGGGDN